ncbi:tRNA dimethylallyltransferase [Urinicoccus massiliensis]|uniref:tRNA dimethylallyltransferase n=1 Tax=Urinicoccus massiliensis TaxID=1723382 RepID=A0A8H2M7U0_9FIRM|nr:tRNA (adenosine(37)-N6)-dimethylallyltransferase MiaA [Urinicoccus massiliensis]VFB16356.1 tRNA dimethylallyltransferase [Urinicoccus massiliensis]
MKKKILILTGPTGVGKSHLSIDLAKALNGEIISADSMQIYKDFDIGTGKIKLDETDGIHHYGLSHVDPFAEYSVAEFSKDVASYIEKIEKEGKLPILVGGTGLYLHSIMCQLDFFKTKKDQSLRQNLEKIYETKGSQGLADLLKELNPLKLESLDKKNPQRLMRALEIEIQNPKQASAGLNVESLFYDPCLIILDRNREELYERINQRVDGMVQEGLFDEVKALTDRGLNNKNQAMKAIGYKEIYQYFLGHTSYEETIDLIKRNSRRYAKRQLTWFRRYENGFWLNLSNLSQGDALDQIISHWREHE